MRLSDLQFILLQQAKLQAVKIFSIIRSSLNFINPLNAELNPICHFLALLEDHLILHISRIRVKQRLIKGCWVRDVEIHEFLCVIRKVSDQIQVSAVLTPEKNNRYKLYRRLVGSQNWAI